MFVSHQMSGELQCSLLMPFHQQPKSVDVPEPCPFDQLRVGIGAGRSSQVCRRCRGAALPPTASRKRTLSGAKSRLLWAILRGSGTPLGQTTSRPLSRAPVIEAKRISHRRCYARGRPILPVSAPDGRSTVVSSHLDVTKAQIVQGLAQYAFLFSGEVACRLDLEQAE